MTQIITDPKEWNRLQCLCKSISFHILIHVTGVLCVCIKCQRKYKLESIGGLKIADA
jgi:hypothetical protein